MKAQALTTVTNEAGDVTQVPVSIEITAVNNFGFTIQYTDITDPAKPVMGSFREDNINLNFANEPEMNRTLTDKKYLLKVVPMLVARVLSGLDPTNTAAKEFKAAVADALTSATKSK